MGVALLGVNAVEVCGAVMMTNKTSINPQTTASRPRD
jgi:hypothetical protein